MTVFYTRLICCVFVLFAVPISIADIRSYRIPDILSLPCFFIILVIRILAAPGLLLNYGGAALFGGALFFCVRLGTRGLGIGDIKFAALIGLFCGLPAVFLAFAVAALTGILGALVRRRLARRRLSAGDSKTLLPFAPFLSLGAVTAYLLDVFF
ncbi:MAG: prepilin peptidase [Spirochaetaceae bacterium]|jgi:prepilin signal peptidase PulO-like enzyme (type II secretory pathway)|nr:prepilin peptidase [Spirochaetaceae bacterium]